MIESVGRGQAFATGLALLAALFLVGVAAAPANAEVQPQQAKDIVNQAKIIAAGYMVWDEAREEWHTVPYAYCYGGGDLEGATSPSTPDPDSDSYYSACNEPAVKDPDTGHIIKPAVNLKGFDATGLTRYVVHAAIGNAGLLHNPAQARSLGGQVIEGINGLRPGDLVYFDYDPLHGLDYIDSVGVMLEGGEVLAAVSESLGIRAEPISWFEEVRGLRFVGGVRFWRDTGEPVGGYEVHTSPQPGRIEVGGWALDPDEETTPLNIYAEVGGEIGVPGAKRYDLGVADEERPDVAEAFPGAGGSHGFDFTFDTEKFGYQPVCVYAASVGQGHDSRLDCEFFFIPNSNPTGSVYLATSPAPGTIHIGGWATDPNVPDAAVGIRAVIGGKAGEAGVEVDDLGLANYAGFANHGFDFTFETQKLGNVPVCVYAINAGPGSDSLLACDAVHVAARPELAAPPAVPVKQPRARHRKKHPRRHHRHRHRHRHRHTHRHTHA